MPIPSTSRLSAIWKVRSPQRFLPDLEDLQAVYQEAGIVLPDLVKRRYEDVKSFHESVVRNRKDYLSSELEAARRCVSNCVIVKGAARPAARRNPGHSKEPWCA